MQYVALLRGINVGGNRKVNMAELKATFEDAGLTDVRTYINSGNVVFGSTARRPALLRATIEAAIERDVGFPVMTLVRSARQIIATAAALPATWTNGPGDKSDVMYLDDDVDTPDILGQLSITPGVDEVRYVPGAVLWHVDRATLPRSGMNKLVGTRLYARMTVRNCNTARKLAAMVSE